MYHDAAVGFHPICVASCSHFDCQILEKKVVKNWQQVHTSLLSGGEGAGVGDSTLHRDGEAVVHIDSLSALASGGCLRLSDHPRRHV